MSPQNSNETEDRKAPVARAPSKQAAGLSALLVTMQHATAQTGTLRALKVLGKANQKRGFDCPGCAWPDPEKRSFAEFCENGAKAILDEATTKRADADFFKAHSIDALRAMPESELNARGRLTVPLRRRRGQSHFEAISYEEAYSEIAKTLQSLESPDAASFYTSGRTSNEAAYLYQLLVRCYGTNNLPDCSNLCHESSGVALKASLGIGKGTVRLSDFEKSDLILVVGQNPGTNHPRMLSALRSAKKAGTKIVSINPLIEPGLVQFAHPQHPRDLILGGVPLSDLFVQVQTNGDQALFRALNWGLLMRERADKSAIDRDFINTHTVDFDAYEAALKKDDLDALLLMAGIGSATWQSLLDMICESRSIIVCWAMGLTQHENAVDTILEVTNFLLLRGNVGRPGAGACPVRGHSNVQGDRTMGVTSVLSPAFGEALERHFQVTLPQKSGLDSVGTIEDLHRGSIKTFVSLGGNFLSASPDTEYTRAALEKASLCAHIATKPNRSHLTDAETTIVLPCLGRTEIDESPTGVQYVTVENSMGVVHTSQGSLPPAHPDLRSEVRIVSELAAALLPPHPRLLWDKWATDYSLVRDAIEQTVSGFSNFNQRLSSDGSFELQNGPRERNFTTQRKKAVFFSTEVRRLTKNADELVLMTVRSHDQFNTTVYSNTDRYRGISRSRHVVLLHPTDLRERGLESGDRIIVTSHFQDQTRTLEDFFALSYNVPQGSAVAYFPEANPLIFATSFAKDSRTPTSKSVRITIKKQEGKPAS